MKTKSEITLCLFLFILLITYGCKKDDDTTVNDIDGNKYNIITIGTQEWLKENLKVIHFNNGDEIPNVTGASQWQALSTGAYCENENDPANGAKYGRLYNWFAVVDSRKLCPVGWHVPSKEEWEVLKNYLADNGFGYEGDGNDIAKSLASVSGWITNNAEGTPGNDQPKNNKTGFTALPGGYRNYSGAFGTIEYDSFLSSTSISSTNNTWSHYVLIRNDDPYLNINEYHKRCGFSVRCLKD